MKSFIDESVEACLTTNDTNVIEGYMKLLQLCIQHTTDAQVKSALYEALEEVEEHMFSLLHL